MVCQGECYNQESDMESSPFSYLTQYKANQIAGCMTLQLEFQSYAGKVGWRLQMGDRRKSDRFANPNALSMLKGPRAGAQDFNTQKTTTENVNLENETQSLKDVKRLLDAYPLDLEDGEDHNLCVEKVLEYRNYIHKMPIFIRLIDFTDHEKIGICYDTLDGSGLAKDMLPEESLALLDGLFGDIKVRIFAVKKLAMLNDSQIALFMPQLIQALKYELFHHSPLAEFLLEKALKNTRVVGHAFFWSLKASLHWPHSRERFYLILERFLMCCGQMKNDFLKQMFVNRSLVGVWQRVNAKLEDKEAGASKQYAEKFLAKQLKREEIRIKLEQQLIISHAKYDDYYFDSNGQVVDTVVANDIDDRLSAQESSARKDASRSVPPQRKKYSDVLDPRSRQNQYGRQYTFDQVAV